MIITRKYNLLAALALSTVLCGLMPGVQAQQFSVETKHMPVQLPSDSGVSFQYDRFFPLSHAVKYHGYYFLKLGVHYSNDCTKQWWDEAVLVAVSEEDGALRMVPLPDEFHERYMSYTADLFVRKDTLWMKSSLSYWKTENHPGYFFDEAQWTWHYVREVSEVAFEDDRYWVEGRQHLCFIEKQTTWVVSLWQQMVPVNRRYDVLGAPIRILNTDGHYYFVHRCQVRKRCENLPPGGQIRRNTMLRDPMFAEVYNYYRDGCYIDEDAGKDHIVYDVTVGESDLHSYFIDGLSHGDTVFDGAFCLDNRIYLVVTVPTKSYIARIENDSLIEVADFRKHFDFNKSTLEISTLNQQNMNPDCCLLVFNDKSGSRECGLIDIEGTSAKVIYFDFPSQNLGSYPTRSVRSTPH